MARQHASLTIFLSVLLALTLTMTALSQGYGTGLVSTSFMRTLGRTLCLCLAALAMDLVGGYAGLLRFGQRAFFALGGHMVGMWLMYARTTEIVTAELANSPLRAP